MKLSFAVALLIGAVAAKAEDPAKPKDYFTSDPRRGTSSAPLPRAPLGGMAKPTKKFEVPKNKEGEAPLSTTMDPTDYESGSGKTYHDKKSASTKDEGPKKPETPAGIDESTETAGTTPVWKVNAGDSPDPAKEKKKDDEEKPAKPAKEDEAKEDMKAAEKAVEKAEKEEKAEKKEAAEKEEKKEKKAAAKEEAKEEKAEPKEATKKKPKSKEPEEASAAKKKPKAKETSDAPESKSFIQTEMTTGCEPAIDVSQKQLDIELDYFSRSFDPKNYKKAMQVYKELKKQGKDTKVSIHTWELYDKAFSFPRVRRYDLVQ